MKLARTITLTAIAILLTGVTASAKSAPGRPVTVYFVANNGGSFNDIGPAQDTASKMFAGIGVNLQWQSGAPSRRAVNPIVIEFADRTPFRFHARLHGLCPSL